MTDIFHEWKENRFIVAPDYLRDPGTHGHMVVLTDIKFWAINTELLMEWCEQHGCTQKGMTVDIPNSELLTAFCLRWR